MPGKKFFIIFCRERRILCILKRENGDTLYQNVPVCHLIYDAIDMAQSLNLSLKLE